MREHPEFAALLDHVAGREDNEVAVHVLGCAACAEAAAWARRLIEAGRRAMAEPKPSRRALDLARKAFRKDEAPVPLLRLIFDSFARPATAEAIRAGALASRFLRFSGDVGVEIEVKEGARGADLFGHLSPHDYSKEVALVSGKTRRRAKVAPDGTFLLRNVPRRPVELRIGSARATLDL